MRAVQDESASLSVDLRRWEALHTPTFVATCVSGLHLYENPENVFNQALVVHVTPRDSNEHRAKFAVASAELKPYNDVSESLRNAGYGDIMDRHELENRTAQADGALGHALVLLCCEIPLLPRLLQVKPVLISHEAIEAYGRSATPVRPSESLTQALKRAIDEDWARFYHMSVITTSHFTEHSNFVWARA
ncbi:hypothetical protein FRC10_002237 [Ceratobasidium sp. 414]|nr:hypothetical protein FRC10_002237 [Ceratobasidium sp. 414]